MIELTEEFKMLQLRAKNFAESAMMIYKQDGFCAPVLMFSKGNETNIIPINFGKKTKQFVREEANALLKYVKPDVVIMVIESWVANVKQKDKEALNTISEQGLKNYKDKKECITIVAESKNCECTVFIEILDSNQRILKQPEVILNDGKKSGFSEWTAGVWN